jgi:plastocyanin
MARTTPTLLPQPTTAPNQPPAITISDAGFAPSEIRIAVGTTVNWRNLGLQGHDVSMMGQDRAVWGSGLLAPNSGASRTFSAPGQYDYTCSLHTVMRGRIVVQP